MFKKSCAPAPAHAFTQAPCPFLKAKNKRRREEELHDKKNAHAVPLASTRQRPANQKEIQAGHSSERTVEGQAKNKNQAQRRHYCEYIAAQEKCPVPHTTTGRPRALMALGELPRLTGGEHR